MFLSMEKYVILILSVLLFGVTSADQTESSLVVSSTESISGGDKEVAAKDGTFERPIIYQMDITSNVSNRFAKTLVASKVRNGEQKAQEASFTVVLPEKAFISEFVMEIGGKSYKAYVKEKEEAKQIYDQAVSQGQSAGHVAVSARDSNKFTVSVNVEPESKVVFLLTYEELLERRNDQYELTLNIRPGQIVKDLNVKVQINESRPLKFVRTPSLRSGNEIGKNDDKLDPTSDIQIINSTSAIVKFNPDSEKQKQFARDLGDKESDGLSGQFVVQYDVERDPYGGEVLLQDGYFVHFFAPADVEPLPKHVLFVLDSSGSMGGDKIRQVKEAMHSILNDLNEGDVMSVLDFGSEVYVWDVDKQNTTTVGDDGISDFEKPFAKLSELQLPIPVKVNNETLEKAKHLTDNLSANGGTNMISGLEIALYLAKVVQDRKDETRYQPILIFLTDGEPNVGIGSTEEITKIVTRLNGENNNVPIFSLSFGTGADKEFLRKLSSKNQGFSRHIYEASDASLQLQEFYKQISSPLLSNIMFKYTEAAKHITRTNFPIYFRGSEIIVAGQYYGLDSSLALPKDVSGWGVGGKKILRPIVEKPVTSLERLWAYLTVKQTLADRELVDDKKELTKKALDLALKYSFVTDITSLVVVKPNETSSVNTEDASQEGRNRLSFHSFAARPGIRPLIAAGIAAPPSYDSIGTHGLTTFGKTSNQQIYSTTIRWTPVSLSSIPTESLTLPPSVQTPANEDQNVTKTLLDNIPWLYAALNPNGTVTIAQSVFELGGIYNLTDPKPCPKIPSNLTQSGECVLLKDCPEVYSFLTDLQTYEQYFCPIENRYAGICCPKKIASTGH